MNAICKMCNADTKSTKNLWYEYDNGEMFVAASCKKCADLHQKLVNS